MEFSRLLLPLAVFCVLCACVMSHGSPALSREKRSNSDYPSSNYRGYNSYHVGYPSYSHGYYNTYYPTYHRSYGTYGRSYGRSQGYHGGYAGDYNRGYYPGHGYH